MVAYQWLMAVCSLYTVPHPFDQGIISALFVRAGSDPTFSFMTSLPLHWLVALEAPRRGY